MDELKKKIFIRNGILAVLLVAAIIFVSVKYAPSLENSMKSLDGFRDYILSFGNMGVLMLAAFQFLQIVIAVIPGEVVQIAGGYVYGTILGSVILIISTFIATVLVFYSTRLIGFPLVKIFVSKEKLEKFEFLTNSKKVGAAMFILFLVPGIPKDALIYIAGLTPIKASNFILISMLARTPGLIGSAFIGASILQKDYTSAIIMGAISISVLILGIIFRKKIISRLKRNST